MGQMENTWPQMYGHQGGKWWWDELGGWDCHVYTNMYQMDN